MIKEKEGDDRREEGEIKKMEENTPQSASKPAGRLREQKCVL